jgi:tripartite-type tricarboxylate transporter receptor subunit TctC
MALALATDRGAAEARAQERFPDRPIRLIVPFAPGGGTDGPSRLIANRASALAGQQMLVENRGGAGGDLAMLAAIAAPPDGHTLVVGHDGTHVRGPLIRLEMPYDARRSMVPVARLFQSWQSLVVNRPAPRTSSSPMPGRAASRSATAPPGRASCRTCSASFSRAGPA